MPDTNIGRNPTTDNGNTALAIFLSVLGGLLLLFVLLSRYEAVLERSYARVPSGHLGKTDVLTPK